MKREKKGANSKVDQCITHGSPEREPVVRVGRWIDGCFREVAHMIVGTGKVEICVAKQQKCRQDFGVTVWRQNVFSYGSQLIK